MQKDTHTLPYGAGMKPSFLALGAGSTFKPASSDEGPWAEFQHLHLIFFQIRWGQSYFWILKEVALVSMCSGACWVWGHYILYETYASWANPRVSCHPPTPGEKGCFGVHIRIFFLPPAPLGATIQMDMYAKIKIPGHFVPLKKWHLFKTCNLLSKNYSSAAWRCHEPPSAAWGMRTLKNSNE